jgi:hypothetical protein
MKKNGFTLIELLGVLGALVAGFVIVSIFCEINSRQNLHKQAIELNMGEYVVNSKTGEAEFKWKVTTNDHIISSCKFTNINEEVFIVTVTKEVKLP